MHLTSLLVENYRAFPRTTQLSLRPLTLFFGYNNSGKSSLLRLLPLLAESFSPLARSPISFSSPTLRGARYEDLVHARASITPLKMGVSGKTNSQNHFEISFSIDQLDTRLVYLRELEVKINDIPAWGVTYSAEGSTSPPLLYDVKYPGRDLSSILINFAGLVPTQLELPDPVSSVFRELTESLGRRSVLWLDALRARPLRGYRVQGEPPEQLEPDGSNAALFLVYDRLMSRGISQGMLLERVSSWFEEEANLRLEVNTGTEDIPILFTPNGSVHSVNLCDHGEGIGQVLPVIVAAALAQQDKGTGRILALEQPELHLHPAMQGGVAKLLASVAASDPSVRILVETHSHDFLLQIQIEILAGRLNPDDVAIHWVQQGEDGSSNVKIITFDQLAVPQNWPPGFFSEGVQKARQITISRLERGHVFPR